MRTLSEVGHEENKDIPPDGGINFLLQEYQTLYTLHQDTKSSGEARLNFFVTFTAAIGSIVIAAQQFIAPDIGLLLLVAGMVIILALGLITFRKMLQRRIATIVYRRRLRRIRAWFVRYYPSIASSIPYDIDQYVPMDWGKYKLGSTASSVAFINSGLIGIAVVSAGITVIGTSNLVMLVVMGLISGGLTWLIHLIWKNRMIKYAENRDNKELAKLDQLSSNLD